MNPYTGSDFDNFLAKEGILEEVSGRAQKRLLALQIDGAMERSSVAKTELAARLKTSRSQLDLLLEPENTAVTLESQEQLALA